MSVAQIQEAVASIKNLPTAQRIELSRWAIAELEPEALYAAFDEAFEAGHYQQIIEETDADYLNGRALSSIY